MSAAPGRLRPRERIDLGDYPVDAAWSSDGKTLVVAGGEGAVLLLSTAAREQPQSIGRHEGGVLALAWQPAGRLFASSGQDGVVLLWDARSLEAKPIHGSKEWSEQLAFADNGRLLAVATGRALHLFDSQGQARHSFADHAGAIAAVAWRPRSEEIAAAGNGGVRVHRLEPRLESRDYPWRGACLTASWNADGRVLAAGMQDGSVHLWYVASGTQAEMPRLGAKVFATGWSANGRFLAAAAGDALVVWDFSGKGAERSRPIELQAHSERITALAFRPSGSWLVSAARDRRLLLWRIGAANEPQDAHLLTDDCTLLRFSRDGARLAVGDARGGMTIYDCTS
ncbi:MAG: WD40 repeat domain-containing protein [Steroidobacteraceae bacterium]|jgi:WD40 repeat protein